MADMRSIFRYCCNRVLSREMGFNKSAAFPNRNINLLRLRYISDYSPATEKSPVKHEDEPVMADLNPVEITPQPVYTQLSGLVNNFKILQNFVDLGVDIRTFERDLRLCSMILKFDFETHVAPYLKFLIQNGVPKEELGNFITANPRILFSDLDNLQVRVNYLCSKKFNKDMIANIITKNPKWLSHEVIFVDTFLGELQRTFHLNGNNVREIVVKYPSILKVKQSEISLKHHMFKNTFLLDKTTIRSLIVETPHLLKQDRNDIMETFFYIKDTMSVPVDIIVKQPKILLYRPHFIKIKHLFLKHLGKDQYDPKLPGYISMIDLVKANDEEFAEKIAMSKVELYYDFQKTL